MNYLPWNVFIIIVYKYFSSQIQHQRLATGEIAGSNIGPLDCLQWQNFNVFPKTLKVIPELVPHIRLQVLRNNINT
jgi:hypothetical protein